MLRRTTAVLAALAAVSTSALMAPAPVSATPSSGRGNDQRTAAAARPTLHGRWVLDGRGRVVLTHGLNMVYKRAPYRPDAIGFGADDAAFLRRNGFTSVRLGLIWKAVEPRPGVYDTTYLRHLRHTITVLHRHGVSTLLDAHQDLLSEQFQGEGAPDWAVLTDGVPNQPKAGFPGNYFSNGALNRAFDNLWTDAVGPGGVGLQERYAAMWRHTVAFLRTTPGLMGIDVFNEPWPGSQYASCAQAAGCPAFDTQDLQVLTQKVIRAVRSVDARTPVFYEPNVIFNNGAPTYVEPQGRNLGFSFHDYCLAADTGTTGGGTSGACQQADSLVWNQMESHLTATGDAPLMTEFGATGDVATLRRGLGLADSHRTGWEEWAYCGCQDPTTTGPGAEQALVLDPAKPPRGTNVDHRKLRVLAEPYPLVVAGTPAAWHWNPSTGVFTARWSTHRAAGRGSFRGGSLSLLATPRPSLPHGYQVVVRGARVVSRRDAATLRLRTRPGAHRVTVRLVRR